VIAALRSGGGKSTGKLHAELCPDGRMTRDEFEEVLGAMARSGLIRLTDSVFEKDGKSIPYRKANLAGGAEALDDTAPMALLMKVEVSAAARRGKRKKKAAASKKSARAGKAVAATTHPRTASDSRVEEVLRNWRLVEARRRGVPAFRVFSDQALKAMAANRPGTAAELLAIPGIGISTVEKYGALIYRLLHEGTPR
jgi:superfamily II DNA helicase RecQ